MGKAGKQGRLRETPVPGAPRNRLRLWDYEPDTAKSMEFWRRKRDSNPRASRPANGFQDRRFQPLTHSSTPYYMRLPGSVYASPFCRVNASSFAASSSSRFITSACWISSTGGVLPCT